MARPAFHRRRGGGGEVYDGVVFDDFEGAFMNETRCLKRALDFRVFCHAPESPEPVSATYGPSAAHLRVTPLGTATLPGQPGPNAASAFASAGGSAGQKGVEVVEVVAVGLEDSSSSMDRLQRTKLTVNSTVRSLWPQARTGGGNFAAAAAPRALFQLAGEYLECRSPPLPLVEALQRRPCTRATGPRPKWRPRR